MLQGPKNIQTELIVPILENQEPGYQMKLEMFQWQPVQMHRLES